MAAVTVSRRRTNAAGAKKQRTYRISGNSGDTLNTRLRAIDSASVNDATIILAAPSGAPGALTLTFTTAGGAFTDVDVFVVGN